MLGTCAFRLQCRPEKNTTGIHLATANSAMHSSCIPLTDASDCGVQLDPHGCEQLTGEHTEMKRYML